MSRAAARPHLEFAQTISGPMASFQVQLSGDWKDFAADDDMAVKAAYFAGEERVQLALRGQQYDFDFSNMLQKNLTTGKARSIRPPPRQRTLSPPEDGAPTRPCAEAEAPPPARVALATKLAPATEVGPAATFYRLAGAPASTPTSPAPGAPAPPAGSSGFAPGPSEQHPGALPAQALASVPAGRPPVAPGW